jgi:hypothetical protein
MKAMRLVLITAAAAALGGCGTAPARAPQRDGAESAAPAREGADAAAPPAAAEQGAAVEAAPVGWVDAAGVPPGFREVFPGVRVDAGSKVVQFDGEVPIDAHDERAPWVFLEVVVCTPDTKEHEALVVTRARASHVHAALLLVGLEPSAPGRWKYEDNVLKPIAPTGERVDVQISYGGEDGAERVLTPQEMIVNAVDAKRFGEAREGRWVFAGSQLIARGGREVYDADGAGTLIGLATFGSETVAWSEVISHEAAVEEPVWVADKRTTPRMGTAVTVTIRRAG